MSRLKRLIREVHERSLWQALAVYLGASWAVLEAVGFFEERFGLPDWLVPAALVLLLLGLPVVIVTSLAREEAYADEVSAEDAGAAAAEDRRLRFLTWRTAGLSFLSAMALWGLIAAGLLLSGSYERVAADERPSVAVLPFENIGAGEENVAFTDGIHDVILTHLSKISSLSVRGHTSVMQYRDTEKNLRQIGEELNARYILSAGVQLVAETVRINLKLIDAGRDEQVWGEIYDRPLTDLLGVQSEVALRVVESVKATLTDDEAERIAARPTESLKAHEHYLRGRGYFRRGLARLTRETQGLWEAARAEYERAVELDPEFSAAWAALAGVHTSLGFIYSRSRAEEEDYHKAEQALERAVELAPESFETHMAQASYALVVTEEMDQAIRHLRMAETLRPDDSSVLYGFGLALIFQGKWEEGLSYFERMEEVDPHNLRAVMPLARINLDMRRFEDAIRYSDRAIALGSSTNDAYRVKFSAYLWGKGDTLEARILAEQYPDRKGMQASLYRVRRDHEAEIDILRTQLPGSWPSMLGALYLSGRLEETRAYADTVARRLRQTSGESRTAQGLSEYRSELGLANAFAGEIEAAVREAEAALEIYPEATDEQNRELVVANVCHTYVLAGEHEAAIDQLEFLLSTPSNFTATRLRLDPFYDPLRDHPRFQALLERYE